MLLDKNKVGEMYTSPVNGLKLSFDKNANVYSGSQASETYNFVDNVPVLVDFNKSVLKADAIEKNQADSPVERHSTNTITSVLKRLVNRRSPVTTKNMGLLRAQLEQTENAKLLIIGGGTVGEETRALSR